MADLPRIMATIRARESGNGNPAGDYKIKTGGWNGTTVTASGAYQFVKGTWARFGGYEFAFQAPPAVQDEKARQHLTGILNRYGGKLESVPCTWYVGHYNPNNLDYVPKGNRLTVRQYQAEWLKTYNSLPTGGGSGGGTGGAFGALGDAITGALAGLTGTGTGSGTAAALASAGGPLAGPAPDKNLPALPLGRPLHHIQIDGHGLWGYIEEAITAGRLSASSSETTLLELTLEDPGHMLLASRVFDEGIVQWGELALDCATVEANGGSAGAGGLVVGFTAGAVNTLRGLEGPLLAANVSPSELIAVMVRGTGLNIVLEQTHQRGAIWVNGFIPEPTPYIDPVTGEETTGDAPAGQDAETYWDAIQRFAKEEGYLAFEAAEVLYFGRPSWLIKNLPARTLVYDPARDGGTRGLLTVDARRTAPTTTGAMPTVELDITIDSELLGNGRGWLPGTVLKLKGLPTFETSYMVTNLDVDLVGGTAAVSASTPVDPEPEGPPDLPAGSDTATADGTADAANTSSPSPAGSPGTSRAGWFHPLGGKGKSADNFGQNRGDHIHAGDDISTPVGTPVFAGRAGKVTTAEGGHGGYGNLITIVGGDGWSTRYGHVSRFSVKVGAEVRGGQLIGHSGGAVGAPGAGNSKGPHLHYETRLNGVPKNPVDTYPPPYAGTVPGRPPPD